VSSGISFKLNTSLSLTTAAMRVSKFNISLCNSKKPRSTSSFGCQPPRIRQFLNCHGKREWSEWTVDTFFRLPSFQSHLSCSSLAYSRRQVAQFLFLPSKDSRMSMTSLLALRLLVSPASHAMITALDKRSSNQLQSTFFDGNRLVR
jgi:hypothetical protein